MKSLDSSHEQVDASDASLPQPQPDRLPRRTARGAGPSPATTPAVAGSASSMFGGAVNAGMLQYRGGGDLAGAAAHQAAASGFAGGGASLPHLGAIQKSFGKHDVGGVRAHVGGAAAQASDALGAVAYASGDSVAFADSPDLHLAAHEAAHIVQQRGGVRLSDGVGRSGDEYERHADEVADLVVRGQSAEAALDRYAHRGAAGGPAIQKHDPHHRHGHHGSGGTPPGRPVGDRRAAAHILQEPNPAAQLQSLRTMLANTARSYGAEFPTDAFNALSRQLQTMISQHRAGSLEEQTVVVSGGMYSYRFTIGGAVTHGQPTDVRSQRGRATATDGSQDQSAYGDSAQTTDGSTDTVGGSATGTDTPAQATGGRGGSVGVTGQHQGTHSHQTGTTGSDSHQDTHGSSVQHDVERIEYVSQVSLQLHFSCEVVRDGWSAVGRAFGTADTDPTRFDTGPQVIGEAPQEQQGAPHAGGGGGSHRPQRIQ